MPDFVEQKIQGFTGINEILGAGINELSECENLLNDINIGELVLSNIGKKDTLTQNIGDGYNIDHIAIIDDGERYLITIDSDGKVRVNKEVYGILTDYDKDKIAIHKVNQTLRISNGITSWFLGKIKKDNEVREMYFEEQFKYKCKIEYTDSTTGKKYDAGTYKHILVLQIDGYQFIKISSNEIYIETDGTRKNVIASIDFPRGFNRVTGVYLFEKGLIGSYQSVFMYKPSDYKTKVDNTYKYANVYSDLNSNVQTLITPITDIDTKIQDRSRTVDGNGNIVKYTDVQPFIYINKTWFGNDTYLGIRGYEENTDTDVAKDIYKKYNNVSESIYSITGTSPKIRLNFKFKKNHKYEILLNTNCVKPYYYSSQYDKGGVTATMWKYCYKQKTMTYTSNTNNQKNTFNTDNTDNLIEFTPTTDIDYIEFSGTFDNSILGDGGAKKSLENLYSSPTFTNGYLIVNNLDITDTTLGEEGSTISTITGYQIVPETRYVVGWSKALIINGKTHYINPIFSDGDTYWKDNYIMRSELTQYDVSIGNNYASLESFDGDKIVAVEELQNGDMIVFKNSSIKRVESSNKVTEISNSHHISSKYIIADGGNVIFATKEGIFLTNGIEFNELSEKIKETYLTLDHKNIILGNDQLGRLHVSDKSHKELILTKKGWLQNGFIFTYYYKYNLLYCIYANEIFSSDIENINKDINLLTAPFDINFIESIKHNQRLIVRSIWFYGDFEGKGEVILKTDKRIYSQMLGKLKDNNWRFPVLPNVNKIQIGIRGNFNKFRLKAIGFLFKPMEIGDAG